MTLHSSNLTVHKFGGAALRDAASIRHAAGIIRQYGGTGSGAGSTKGGTGGVAEARTGNRTKGGDIATNVVVASALGGVTDALLNIALRATTSLDPKAMGEVRKSIELLTARHKEAGEGLENNQEEKEITTAAQEMGANVLAIAEALHATRALTPELTDSIVAHGERLSAKLLAAWMRAGGVHASYVDATEIIQTDGRAGNAAVDLSLTGFAAEKVLQPLLERGITPVIPGFIGAGGNRSTVTLGRGGSDRTATVLGTVLRARDVVLWKDVPGLMTADPRVVPDARVVPTLHVREAAELAYHGAKVLHPRALIGLHQKTRVLIRPYANPTAAGTEVSFKKTDDRREYPVRAISAIENQTLITLAGSGMVGVPGVAARTFTALERVKISASLISQASSEATICFTVAQGDAAAAAKALQEAFSSEIARREIDGVIVSPPVATLAVVGLGMSGTVGVSGRLFGALAGAGVNIIAIAQGSSELNISVVVDQKNSTAAQQAVHDAFQLGKIGGGRARSLDHSDLVLLGFGKIGRELAAQLAATRGEHSVRVVGIIDRGGYIFDAKGFSPRAIANLVKHKEAGGSVGQTRGVAYGTARGVKATVEEAINAMASHALTRPILVDATAYDSGTVLHAAVTYGMDLVLANKRPLADSKDSADALHAAARKGGRRVLHEATVGAGLPIIDTLNKLVESGDKVLRIEGCPSGTMGYLFGELGRGTSFSDALRGAMKLGYTEPDPRDDLSGMDVARKALILGRLVGYHGGLNDVKIESLVPEHLQNVPLEDFLSRLDELNSAWARRVASARDKNTVLRYRATVTPRAARVGIVAVETSSPLGSLSGTDNQFTFITKRYRDNPLVITGPGAGPAVTAAGVLNDVLKLAGSR